MYACSVAYTEQVTFYKVAEKTRPCLSGHSVHYSYTDTDYVHFTDTDADEVSYKSPSVLR